MKNWLKSSSFFVFGVLIFAYGVGVGKYKLPPSIMFAAKTLLERLLKRDNEYTGEAELLVYAFTDPG